ncbi:MAG TPA: tripartite tricarboxylate transporter substrate binding protein [Advenella sp.]|nr:tripartite tricarboxylate transporter substrate binding protein [Advenella sp.]
MSKHYLRFTPLLLLLSPALAWANNHWPDKPVKLVVGYAAGGPVDTAARQFAKFLGEQIGQPVVVENKTGASGIIAAENVARAPADGSVLYFLASPTLTITPHIQKGIQIDKDRDFRYLGNLVEYTNVLVVNNKLPVKSISDLIAYAKANPGALSFGSAGVGSSNQLSAELLKQRTGTQMLHVPYRGNAPAMIDVIGGKTSMMFDITGTAINYINSGKVRALAVTSKERNRALPGVPSMSEAGIADYDVTGWYGIVGPAKLDDATAGQIEKALKTVSELPGYRKQMEKVGYTISLRSGKQLKSRIDNEYRLWDEVTAKAGIQADK